MCSLSVYSFVDKWHLALKIPLVSLAAASAPARDPWMELAPPHFQKHEFNVLQTYLVLVQQGRSLLMPAWVWVSTTATGKASERGGVCLHCHASFALLDLPAATLRLCCTA